MEQKEIRLNGPKRKSLIIDNHRHWEEKDCPEKQDFLGAREDATETIDSAFAVMKTVVERRYPLIDVADYQRLGKKHNTVDATGIDSCFFAKSIDAPTVLDSYNDEVEKSKHFSWELDGDTGGSYGSSHYGSGSSNNGKNFAYAMYREDMKKVGLNPDCNIENDINNVEATNRGYKTNPYLSQCRNDNFDFLSGKQGGTNRFQEWKDKFQLNVIGTGGCKSRAIPCSDLEFAKFEMMHQAKQDVVLKHTKWLQVILAKVKLFEAGVKLMTKFSQVEKYASHPKINWTIDPEILVDKFGTDVVISIDNLADQTYNIGKPKQTLEEKIQARMLYDNSKVSSIAS
jgi:hypothetical protein